MSDTTLKFELLDICYPDYLTNHCNGDNEVLLSSSWWDGITSHEAKDELVDSASLSSKNFWDYLPEEDDAAYNMLGDIISKGLSGISFDLDEVDEPDEMMIYGRLSW